MPRIDLQPEFVVAAADVLDERIFCANHWRAAEVLETAHGS